MLIGGANLMLQILNLIKDTITSTTYPYKKCGFNRKFIGAVISQETEITCVRPAPNYWAQVLGCKWLFEGSIDAHGN